MFNWQRVLSMATIYILWYVMALSWWWSIHWSMPFTFRFSKDPGWVIRLRGKYGHTLAGHTTEAPRINNVGDFILNSTYNRTSQKSSNETTFMFFTFSAICLTLSELLKIKFQNHTFNYWHGYFPNFISVATKYPFVNFIPCHRQHS